MPHVISNPNVVTLDMSIARSSRASRHSAAKSRQGLFDALAALAGMALVLASWYGLNLALQIMAIRDVAPFIAD